MQKFQEKMKLFYENEVINWHEHVWFNADRSDLNWAHCDKLVESMNAMGINKTVVSNPVTWDRYCAPEVFRFANDTVLEAIKKYPKELAGMCFINAGWRDEAIKEIQRCYDAGMLGIKMYHQYFINDTVLFPIIEKCIELDIPILVHAGKLTVNPLEQPHISDGTHFADVAKRYPEANFIMAHITGGGDWQWQLRSIIDCKNVVTDMSGSVCDRPVLEQTVAALGAERLLFGTDISAGPCVGKMLNCDLSLEDKKTILAGTAYRRFLRKGV